jgi:hypothetical protein
VESRCQSMLAWTMIVVQMFPSGDGSKHALGIHVETASLKTTQFIRMHDTFKAIRCHRDGPWLWMTEFGMR